MRRLPVAVHTAGILPLMETDGEDSSWVASGRFEPTRPVWEAIRQWRPLMEKPDVSGTCEWLQVLLELTRAQEAVTSFAGVLTLDHNLHHYMTETNSYCYRHLIADPLCCKDQRLPTRVRHEEVSRAGAEWTCDAAGIECNDGVKGTRGKDLLWWPEAADCSTPRILFVHGGGWQRHGPKEASYDVFAANLAQVTGAAVLVPDYLLVPLGNYLTILDYLLDSWQWLAKHGPSGEDCTAAPRPPMFVAGDSSGGASALSMLLQLSSKGLPLAAGFFAFSPWINLACNSPTYYSNAFSVVNDVAGKIIVGDILFRGAPTNVSHSLRELALKYFQGDASRLSDPLYSPFHATEAQLDELPPIYLAVSGSEVMTGAVAPGPRRGAGDVG
ncbi:unnamed protein product [Durusdinium trenchii]|uniref:Alpha/beta hydrolase fold-3 domain-containing protein n=1 Tax=Durusdinium trenchii TaxID=1381693 RepID=A0ABP0RXJ7_9DINO